ncbi:MAG: DUF4136 domain-containing protein [Pseudoxanthomonas suwonensis]|nr:DUF4136 domain-containing protein [Pseudoxanthomonas suwonensis]
MTMHRLRRFVPAGFVAAFVLLLAACATGPQVRTDVDPQANFGQYRTWSWYEPIAMEESGYSNWISERIKMNIQREMEARGYRYSAESPDLRVNFQGYMQERSQVYTQPRQDVRFYYDYRFRRYVAVPVWYDEARVSRYTEGTLSVDLVDARRNHMVWTGDAIGRVVSRDAQQRAAEVDASIAAIFSRFPFQAGSSQPLPVQR